jgi:hypothetical protein
VARPLSLIALLALLISLLPAAEAQDELRELFRGARAQAMGNASVAIVDDEEAVYLNPAGVGGLSKYGFQYFASDVDVSNDVVLSALDGGGSIFSDGLSDATIQNLMGKDTYARVQITPTILMTNLAVGLLMDGQAAVYAKNPAYPSITLGYQFTNGLQAAYGISLLRNRRSRHEVRVGFGAKLLWRRGGYRLLGPIQVTSFNTNTLGEVAGGWGMGYGADIGFQYVNTINPQLKLNYGFAWTDIGDTTFGVSAADPIKNNLSMGIGGTYLTGQTKVTLAYDYRHMTRNTDWRKRNHIGMEVTLPVLTLYGGLNQSYFTYGAGFDAWLFRITALSYGEELGTYLGQDSSRRWMLKIAMKAGL